MATVCNKLVLMKKKNAARVYADTWPLYTPSVLAANTMQHGRVSLKGRLLYEVISIIIPFIVTVKQLQVVNNLSRS